MELRESRVVYNKPLDDSRERVVLLITHAHELIADLEHALHAPDEARHRAYLGICRDTASMLDEVLQKLEKGFAVIDRCRSKGEQVLLDQAIEVARFHGSRD